MQNCLPMRVRYDAEPSVKRRKRAMIDLAKRNLLMGYPLHVAAFHAITAHQTRIMPMKSTSDATAASSSIASRIIVVAPSRKTRAQD